MSPDTVVSSLVRFQTDGEFLKPKSSSERSIFDPMLNHVVVFLNVKYRVYLVCDTNNHL